MMTVLGANLQNWLPEDRGALETLSAFNSSEHRYFPRRLSETMAWNKQSHHTGPRIENKANTELSGV